MIGFIDFYISNLYTNFDFRIFSDERLNYEIFSIILVE